MAKSGKNHKGGNTDAGSGLIVNGQELARILGCSRQYVTSYRKAGMPIHDNNGPRQTPRYNTADCIRWKRDVDIKKARGSSSTDEDELDIDEIRRRTELAKMKKEEIELSVLEERYGDIEAILKGMAEAKAATGKGKPVCVLLKTMMGNGVDFMMHTHAWHGKAPNDEQLESALAQNAETLGDY